MFFVFSKILYFLINPIVWISLLLLLAIIFRKKTALLKSFLIAAFAVLIIFSNSALFTYCAKSWEVRAIPPQQIKNNYYYAVVLGGMASADKTGKVHFGTSMDRILSAIILYKKGKVKKIVLTGGSGLLLGKEKREAPILETFCEQMGVPVEDIIVEPDSRNTYENAVFTKNKIGIHSDKILLITSAFHMRRSMACFKKQGFAFDVLATDPIGQPVLYIDDYFVPKSEPLMKWDYLIKEWIGFYAYKWAGYTD